MVESTYVTKQVLHPGRLFRGNTPPINSLDVELTERCNNACVHCYINLPIDDDEAIRREFTTEEWKDILDQAAEVGALSVRFTGGEPLLREDFEDIYLHTRRLGMKVILFTNARLITPKLVELFTKVPPLMKIEVSVYGMHEKSYDRVTCTSGGYAEYHQGIRLLLENKIPFTLKSVILPGNKGDQEGFEEWVATIPWMQGPPSYSIFLELRTRRDSSSKNRLIASMRFSPEEGLAFLSKNTSEYFRNMAHFGKDFLHPQGDQLFNCGVGEKPCVDAYGNLQLCMLLRHPDYVYDLRKGSLRVGLTEAFPRFRDVKATNPDYLTRCARCFLKGLCEQCPAKSWSEHGTLDTPVEYLCQVAHTQARFLGLLNEGENAWEIEDWHKRIETLIQKATALE